MVSLSYHDAGRWLDAQETVEQVPAPPHVIEWMRAFADEHYVIEPQEAQAARRASGPCRTASATRFGVDGKEVRDGGHE